MRAMMDGFSHVGRGVTVFGSFSGVSRSEIHGRFEAVDMFKNSSYQMLQRNKLDGLGSCAEWCSNYKYYILTKLCRVIKQEKAKVSIVLKYV